MEDTPRIEIVDAAPTGSKKMVIAIGIVLFLLVQIAIPASYYLADAPTSERFSWRMFSSVDLSTWKTKVTAVGERNGQLVEREVQLAASLQETYVKAVQRAQLDIVEPFMRQVVEEEGVREVRFEALGTFPSGKAMKPIQLSLKRNGELVELSRP